MSIRQEDNQTDQKVRQRRGAFPVSFASVSPFEKGRSRFKDWFIDGLQQEQRRSEPFLWLVLCFLIGIAAYFQAPQEPSLFFVVFVFILLGFLTWQRREKALSLYVCSTFLCALGGFALASFHTSLMPNDAIASPFSVVMSGTIKRIEPRPDGSRRLTLEDLDPSSGVKQKVPERVRLRVLSRTFTGETGDRIRFRAGLRPPPGPVMAGGYDFSRDLFFKGIGATGFIYGHPIVIEKASNQSWWARPWVETWRAAISKRILLAFETNGSAEQAGVANALLVGERGYIKPDTREALVASGLAHILAISGLHMALVVTFVIFATRALLALNEHWTLHAPIWHIAVLTGIVTGAIYYTLSGGSISATRAFVMVSIMAIALLFGRRALSLRNVAIAAIIILALSPLSLLNPGFQMSFAATLVLVAFAGFWLIRRPGEGAAPGFGTGSVLLAKNWLTGLIVTSLLAGLATGLFAAFHFHRVAPFGLIANLLAIPVFSFIVMPTGFLGMVFMPFGFEVFPFKLMAWGLKMIVGIADWVAGFSGPFGRVGMIHETSFLILAISVVLISVMKSRLRLLFIPVVFVAFLFLEQERKPDVFIAEDGKTVALALEQEPWLVSGERAGRFELSVWKNAHGLFEEEDEVTPSTANKNLFCDIYGCTLAGDGILIAHVKHPGGFYEDCRRADIVVSTLSAPAFCEKTALVIDRRKLQQSGAHTIYLNEQHGKDTRNKASKGIRVQTAIPLSRRPWHRHYPEPIREKTF